MILESDGIVRWPCDQCGERACDIWIDNDESWCLKCLSSDRLAQLSRIERMETEMERLKMELQSERTKKPEYTQV